MFEPKTPAKPQHKHSDEVPPKQINKDATPNQNNNFKVSSSQDSFSTGSNCFEPYTPSAENLQSRKRNRMSIDLNLPPSKKPKKKKHIPKVVTDFEKEKKIPKSKEKSSMTKGTQREKKMPARRTKEEILTTPSADVLCRINGEYQRTSVKRSLAFDSDDQRHGKQDNSEWNSNFHCPEQARAQNSTEYIATHINSSAIQFFDNFTSLLKNVSLPTRRHLIRGNLKGFLARDEYDLNATRACKHKGVLGLISLDINWGRRASRTTKYCNAKGNRDDDCANRRKYFPMSLSGGCKQLIIPAKPVSGKEPCVTTFDERKAFELMSNFFHMELSTLIIQVYNSLSLLPQSGSTTHYEYFSDMFHSVDNHKNIEMNKYDVRVSGLGLQERRASIYGHQHSSSKSRGSLKIDPHMNPSSDDIDQRKGYLRKSGELMVPTNIHNALVPYNGNNQIVPYKSRVGRRPKKKPLCFVDIDPKTEEMWNLLMSEEAGDGVEGIDKEKEAYWFNERQRLCKKAETFVSFMHAIQGSRRFSAWDGTVLDSAIGVFLTQNVADSLSSSTFINLASRFPSKQMSNDNRREFEDPNNRAPNGLGFMKLLSSFPSIDIDSKISLNESQPKEPKKFMDNTGSLNQLEENIRETVQLNMSGNSQVLSAGVLCSSQFKHQMDQNIKLGQEESLNNKSNLSGNIHLGMNEICRSTEPEMFYTRSQNSNNTGQNSSPSMSSHEKVTNMSKMNKKPKKEKKLNINWDDLRKEACKKYGTRVSKAVDSVDWEAVRCADVKVIAEILKGRGQNNRLSQRIQDFLNRIVKDHGSLNLEWLRDVPSDKLEEYLLSVDGLGKKSVECLRLLTFHHVAFPVDTNVARIVVRLGWVPIQPLPESLQLHLLKQYPVMDSIQKYLWPRLCRLDQQTLYELHYQLITFGKVFCTKNNPNCNACPMKGECKHFATALASARPALPRPEEDGDTSPPDPFMANKNSSIGISSIDDLPEPEKGAIDLIFALLESEQGSNVPFEAGNTLNSCNPTIEEPSSPESTLDEFPDMEDFHFNDSDEMYSLNLVEKTFVSNVDQFGDISKDLVALNTTVPLTPTPKLKNLGKLRSEHLVYELPDSHPLLEELGMEKRVDGDVCPYLLSIWTPDEIAEYIERPKTCCGSRTSEILYSETTCFSCNYRQETDSQFVRGTLMIPSRTAMKGCFPLNGTYFQVNEVFADDETSRKPINVPRSSIWHLNKRIVYCARQTQSVFSGQSIQDIQSCFRNGYICLRGFNRKVRRCYGLVERFHPRAKVKAKQTTNANQEKQKRRGRQPSRA